MHRFPVRERTEVSNRIPAVINAIKLCKEERLDEALHAVDLLDQQGVPVSRDIIYHLLQGCTKFKDILAGKRVHCLMVKHGLDSVAVLGDHLIRLFALDGSLQEADQVFLKVLKPSVFTWNAIISAHANLGQGARVIELYVKMQQQGIKSDTVTLLLILKACSSTSALGKGRLIHDQVIRSGQELDVMLGSSLVDMYAKCGDLEEAHKVFDSLASRDVVSWGAIIAGYAAHGLGLPALELFKNMQKECIKPNEVIFWCILKACGSTGATVQGRLTHELIIKHGIELDDVVANTLIDMYANSGSLEDALKVFKTLLNPNMVSWGALISGFSRCGYCELALGYLDDMKSKGLKPDDMIYTSILNACSHAGLLEDGYKYFNSMVVDDDVTPSIEHYGCMVDLLGRLGRLKEATKLLQSMPFAPNAIVWLSLLASCKTYHNIELGRHCFNEISNLDPRDASGYMLISNIYADAQMWEDASKVQDFRKNAGARKKGGKAWAEINNKVHEFMVGIEREQENEEISDKFSRLGLLMKGEGYVPQFSLILDDISNDDKEDDLFWHSRKQAVAFGLISMHIGTSIRITTNFASYCYSYMSVSTVEIPKITTRNRFHTFLSQD